MRGEANALANDVDDGLASLVWTTDLRTAYQVSGSLEFGLVGVNDWYPVTPEALRVVAQNELLRIDESVT